MTKPRIEIEKTMTVNFDLPGVRYSSATRSGGSNDTQLETPKHWDGEGWGIKITAGNCRETAAALRAVADAIDGAAGALEP